MGGSGPASRLDTSGVAETLCTQAESGRRVAAVVPLRSIRTVAGRVVARMPRGACRLVPAEGGLLPHRTVLGNLVHGNRVVGRPIPYATAASEVALTASGCGLDDVLDRYPHEITPGRRRIAGLARALCGLLSGRPDNPERPESPERPRLTTVVLEDAPDLPTWPNLLESLEAPELLSIALILLTYDAGRATGFELEYPSLQGNSDV